MGGIVKGEGPMGGIAKREGPIVIAEVGGGGRSG